MAQPLANQDRDLIDVRVSDLRVAQKGRQALADGELRLALPGFDPELALDIIFAVAYWEDNYGTIGPSS